MGCFQAVAGDSITCSHPQFEDGAAYFVAAEESPPSDFVCQMVTKLRAGLDPLAELPI